MSLRTKSDPKLKNSLGTYKRKLEKMRSSLQKVTKIQVPQHSSKVKKPKGFNSPSSSKKVSSRKQSVRTIQSHNSPFNGGKFASSLKPSECSFESLEKLSIFQRSSEEITVESPVFKHRPRTSFDSADVEGQLAVYKRRNQELQIKIENLKKNVNISSNKIRKNSPSFSDLDQNSNEKSSVRGSNFLIDFEKDFSKEKLKKVKRKYKEKVILMKKQLQNVYQEEIRDIQSRHEIKIKNKIEEVTGEYQRKVDRSVNENLWLKKQNEKLKNVIQELSSKLEVSKKVVGNVFEDKTNDQDRKYNEIFKQFMQLQKDYLKMKNDGGGLCHMCKALTNTNSQISSKIHRIRAFLDSENN
jgi:hypothetical protein